jgi:O-antigen ligase
MEKTFIWRSGGRTGYGVAYALLLLVTIVACYSCLQLGYEPAWAMAAIAVGAGILIAFCKWPILMFAGLVFVGQFKTIPAKGISLSDPTMLMFLLCCGAIAVDWLRGLISAHSEWSLAHLFAGQAFRIGLFMLFVTALGVSFLYTPAEEYGRTKLLRFLTFEILVFFGPILLLKDEKALRPLLWAMIVLSFPLLAREIIRVWHPSEQVVLGDVDVTELGHGAAFATAILIALYSRLIRSRILLGCILGLMSVGMVLAAARTPALALLITLIICPFVLRAPSPHLKLRIMLPILSLIVVVGAVTFLWIRNTPAMRQRLESKQNEVQSMVSGTTKKQGTIAKRLEFYNSALDAVTKHPLTGLGLGGWSVFYSGPRIEGVPRARYPHNFLLEVASEQGLPGLTLLLALLASLFHSARKLAKYPEFAFLFAVLTFQVLDHAFTGSFEDRPLWFWFGMVVAVSRLVHNSALPWRAAQWQRAYGGFAKPNVRYKALSVPKAGRG